MGLRTFGAWEIERSEERDGLCFLDGAVFGSPNQFSRKRPSHPEFSFEETSLGNVPVGAVRSAQQLLVAVDRRWCLLNTDGFLPDYVLARRLSEMASPAFALKVQNSIAQLEGLGSRPQKNPARPEGTE